MRATYNAGLYLNHNMDLTEEGIQIWYFGPDDVVTKSKCPPTRRLPHRDTSTPTIGNIYYLHESHHISCIH